MKISVGFVDLVRFAAALVLLLPAAAPGQMMQGGMMGGGRRTMINLASPADSPTQIRRGVVVIGSYAFGMMARGATSSSPRTTGESGAPGIRMTLYLNGVTNADGLVTATGNHLIFDGEITAPAANRTPINIDQQFALRGGNASVQAVIDLPAITGPATITIDRIAIEDGRGNVLAMPGVALAQPTAQTTPGPTPGARCVRDSDCDDGDPNTQDLCMPMGCRHTSDHMGPGGPMM